MFNIVCLLLSVTLLCWLSCVKVWLYYNQWLLSYWILSKNRRDFHKWCNILATISHNATKFSHMIDNLKTFHIVPNKLYKTINLISYFQIVNILARKIKGETSELNRPLGYVYDFSQRFFCVYDFPLRFLCLWFFAAILIFIIP